MRHPRKRFALQKLRDMGVPVGAVLDVGVQTCTKELIDIFPDVPHVLMEPLNDFNDTIAKIYGGAGVQYELINAAISNSDGEIDIEVKAILPGQAVSHAKMVDSVNSDLEHRRVPMRSLDSIISERSLETPYLLKIDIDGAEMSVLKGARNVLQDCSVVVIEATITNLMQRANFICEAGFQFFDIVDICYYDDRLVQVDLFFLSSKVIQERGLGIYKDGFDYSKWVTYRPEDL